MDIESIKKAPIYGNHYQDHDLWSKMNKIILDETADLSLRAAASKKVGDIVGESYDPSISDSERVRYHVKTLML